MLVIFLVVCGENFLEVFHPNCLILVHALFFQMVAGSSMILFQMWI